MTKTSPGTHRCPKRIHPRLQFSRKSVLRMLAVMSDDIADAAEDFLTTGRVGRRNAMANILSEHALTTTSDLPEKLNLCTLSDGNPERSSDSENLKGEGSPSGGPEPSSES